MRPSTRTIDYVTLVQNGVMTVDQVPADIKAEVTRWVRYFQGIDNSGAVKEQPTEPTKPVPTKEMTVNDNQPNN